jgi:hypothetical protein
VGGASGVASRRHTWVLPLAQGADWMLVTPAASTHLNNSALSAAAAGAASNSQAAAHPPRFLACRMALLPPESFSSR